MITTLEKLKPGHVAVVREIKGGHGMRQRLGNLGIHPSDEIQVIRSGFFGGPVLIEVHGAEVGLGQGMAEKIEVEIEEP
jgi:Fe2+ transport system protein FeoA